MEKLADGFHSLGGEAHRRGRDALLHRPSSPADLQLVGSAQAVGRARQHAGSVSLAVDASGNLLVLSSDGRDGTVYSFRPGSPDTEVTVIAPTPAADHPHAATVLPVNWWNNGEFKDQLDLATYQFTTLAEMFARDMALPKSRGICLARWQSDPAGLPRLPARSARLSGHPFSDALDHLWFHDDDPDSGCSSPTVRKTRPIAVLSDSMVRLPI